MHEALTAVCEAFAAAHGPRAAALAPPPSLAPPAPALTIERLAQLVDGGDWLMPRPPGSVPVYHVDALDALLRGVQLDRARAAAVAAAAANAGAAAAAAAAAARELPPLPPPFLAPRRTAGGGGGAMDASAALVTMAVMRGHPAGLAAAGALRQQQQYHQQQQPAQFAGVKRPHSGGGGAGDDHDDEPQAGGGGAGGFRTGTEVLRTNQALAGGGRPMGMGLAKRVGGGPGGGPGGGGLAAAGPRGGGAAAAPPPPPPPAMDPAAAAAAAAAALAAGGSIFDATSCPREALPKELQVLDEAIVRELEACIAYHPRQAAARGGGGGGVSFDDISGLATCKTLVYQNFIQGRGDLAGEPASLAPPAGGSMAKPARGLLLFGPPGTGKTLIGKAIATECGATFFNVASSSISSKWIGNGEKAVKALFALARLLAPSIVFIDEIDSMLSERGGGGEHESSRKVKNQFLVELDGFGSGDAFVVVVGATNRPGEIDEAARRRFTKRVYVPLPDGPARAALVRHELRKESSGHAIGPPELDAIVAASAGYSGADLVNVCSGAAVACANDRLMTFHMAKDAGVDLAVAKAAAAARRVSLADFRVALAEHPRSVDAASLQLHERWDAEFGSRASPVGEKLFEIWMRGRRGGGGGSGGAR